MLGGLHLTRQTVRRFVARVDRTLQQKGWITYLVTTVYEVLGIEEVRENWIRSA